MISGEICIIDPALPTNRTAYCTFTMDLSHMSVDNYLLSSYLFLRLQTKLVL